jgi:hypothetical protein
MNEDPFILISPDDQPMIEQQYYKITCPRMGAQLKKAWG